MGAAALVVAAAEAGAAAGADGLVVEVVGGARGAAPDEFSALPGAVLDPTDAGEVGAFWLGGGVGFGSGKSGIDRASSVNTGSLAQ